MSFIKADDIYEVFKKLHIWSKLVGLTSFSVKIQDGEFVGFKTCFNFLCILLSTFWNLAIGVGSYQYFKVAFEASNVYNADNAFEKFSYFLTLGLYIFSNLSSCWWIFFKQKDFCDILNGIREVDDKLKQLKFPIDLKKHKKFVLIFIVTLKLLICLIAYGSYEAEVELKFFEPNFLFFINMCFITDVAFLTGVQFVLWLVAVKLRYQKINCCLENVVIAAKLEQDEDEGPKIITEVARLHEKLAEVSEAINRCFGYPVRKSNFN